MALVGGVVAWIFALGPKADNSLSACDFDEERTRELEAEGGGGKSAAAEFWTLPLAVRYVPERGGER